MLRRLVIYIVLLVSHAVFAAVYTPSSVPDPKKNGQGCYVANPDRLLADSDVVWLNTCAQKLDAATHVELCVVALQSIGESDAFDFAYELFQRWGIGRKDQNAGVLMLFVEESHDIRIMTGVGIEGVLPDARCSQIIHDDMIPAFRAGDYGGGLCLGALRIYEICTEGDVPEELLAIRSVTNRGQYAEEEEDELMIGLAVIVGTVGLVILILWWASVKRCPKCKRRRAHATREQVLLAATYSHAGKGERTYKCAHCGNMFVVPFIIPRRSHTVYVSGGSRGGFGGGGFSGGGSWGGGSTFGGGAGGKW